MPSIRELVNKRIDRVYKRYKFWQRTRHQRHAAIQYARSHYANVFEHYVQGPDSVDIIGPTTGMTQGQLSRHLAKERRLEHIARFPWLFPIEDVKAYDDGSDQSDSVHKTRIPLEFKISAIRGMPRWDDPIELRRLATSEICQLCIEQYTDTISNTPYHIIESNPENLKMIRRPMDERPKGWAKKEADRIARKADRSKQDMIYELLESCNSMGYTWPQTLSAMLQDGLEVGDGVFYIILPTEAYEELDDGSRILRRQSDGRIIEGIYPTELLAENPLQFTKEIQTDKRLTGYYYYPQSQGQSSRHPVRFEREELAWLSLDPRSDMFYGVSPVSKLRNRLDLMLLTVEQETDLMVEGGIFPCIIALDKDMDVTERDRFEKWVREKGRGHVEETPIIQGGVDVVKMSWNYQELQFLERQLWYAKITAGMFKQNLTVIGLAHEGSNRATAYAEKLIADEGGILPVMHWVENGINYQIIRPYYGGDYLFAFDPTEQLETRERMSGIAVSQYQSGLITKNEAREKIGEEPTDDGDEFMAAPVNDFDLPGPTSGFRPSDPADDKSTASPSSLSKKNERLTKSESSLATSVSAIYGDFFDSLIRELDANSDYFDTPPEPEQEWQKSAPISMFRTIITTLVTGLDLVPRVVETIADQVGPEVVRTVQAEHRRVNVPGSRPVDDHVAVSRFTDRRADYYAEIPDTMTDEVLQVLQDGLNNGESWQEVRDRLLAQRDNFTDNRAATIARTEIGRAQREGVLIYGEQNADLLDKKWVSTRDGRTRPSHRAMNGTVMDMQTPFVVPYNLDNPKYSPTLEQYPGESIHGINCRCRVVLVSKSR